MKVVVPRETAEGEARVAATPRTVQKMVRAGLAVVVESGAGAGSRISDEEFEEMGATIAADTATLFDGAEIVLKARPPDAGELAGIPAGAHLISVIDPLIEHDLVRRLAEANISTFALDLMPRIARAQSMDVLSAMSTLTGYHAVLLAAQTLPSVLPYLTTAAGTLHPAKVLVLGAGVAGLQAIATARRLGALVTGYDVRPAVKEQVESLGAKFLELDVSRDEAEDAGGYATRQSDDQVQRQQEAMAEFIAGIDIVITTALIPGRPAPVLITAEMVGRMKPGSVIVDLAAERGGNCELTEADRTVDSNGVTILGPLNIPSRLPVHASLMLANNITNFLLHLCSDAKLEIDLEDEITRGTLVTHQGAIVHERVREAIDAAGPAGDETVPG